MTVPIGRVPLIAASVLLAVVLASSLALPSLTAIRFVPQVYLLANVLGFLAIVSDGRRGGVSFMVSFFFLWFIALPAYVQVSTDVFPWQATYLSSQLTNTFAVLALAQLSFIAGQSASAMSQKGTSDGVPSDSGNAWARTDLAARSNQRHLLRWLAFLCVGGAVIAVTLGPSVLFRTRGAIAQDLDVGQSSGGITDQLALIGRSVSLLALLICLYALFSNRAKRISLLVVLVVVVVPLFLALNYPPSLPRFQLIGSALAILSIMTSMFRGYLKAILGLAAPVFLFFFFPIIKAIGTGTPVGLGTAFQRNISDYLVRVDFDAFKQIADTGIYLNVGPHRWGSNFLGVIFFWVPRAVWPGKPIDSGQIVSQALGYSYNNVSNPLPSEAWISFGAPGVVVVFLGVGYLIAVIERRARFARVSPGLGNDSLLYALCVGFSVIIMRGALDGVAPYFATGFVIYFAIARTGVRLHNWRSPNKDAVSV